MRKLLLLFGILTGFAISSNAQTIKTYTDNFESFSNNDWLAQNSSVWDSWSGTPSTTGDDVRVTNSDSYSGSKSIYFSSGPGPEDIVLPFGGLHGRGQLFYSAMMKIPKGKSAYFNFQGAVAPGTTWAVEVSMETNGGIAFSNLTSGTMFSSTYPQGKWFEMKIYVNHTKNEWHVIIDGEYKGKFTNSVNKSSFLNLYPADKDASFWVDDVTYTHYPAMPNNAGIEELVSPKAAVCGKNNIEVRVVNNGTNALDSIRVNWSVDGVKQKTIYVKSKIDTIRSTAGNTLDLKLDSVFNLSKGRHVIKAWTSHPNGVADTLNLDDTLVAVVNAEVTGAKIDYAKPFQGKKGQGTAAWPDTVCASDTINYTVVPPTGYSYADFGKDWTIKSVDIKSNGVAPKDTLTLPPKGNNGFRLRYMGDTTESNKIFKISITVGIGSGCDTTLEHYFFVSPIPHVAFTANDACLGKLTRFVNTSKGGGSNNYLWNFGDNTTSKFIGTSKRYTSTGVYAVTLRATAPSGCKAFANQTINVYDIPEPKFGVMNACDSTSVVFTDSSTIANGTIAKYYWEFGDGDTSINQNPSHLYDKVGTYPVRLTITSGFGCTEKIDGEAIVYPSPDAAITGMDACGPVDITFTNNSTYSGTDQLKFTWNFGDGNTSTDEAPVHNYANAGNYTVKMMVATPDGCMDSAETMVEIFAIPTADFSVSNSCLGDTTSFVNNSSGNITNYEWSLRQGNKSADENPTVVYDTEGILNVRLIVTATGGCVDTVFKDIEIYALPEAAFALTNACQGTEVSFNNQSTSTSDTLSYSWSFGDGNSSTDLSPSNTFTSDGTYNVELTATTENGCSNTAIESLEIYPLPDAGFTFEHKGWGQYDFTPADANLVSYEWDFGDGKTSTDVAPYHEYDAEGDYDVMLTTTDDNSCISENTINVSVSTSIEDKTVENPFNVFPNPFTQELNIVYELQNESKVIVEVYNLNGQLIESLVNQEQVEGKHQVQFETADASGIYLIKMVVDNNVYHQQIIKSR
jgi:PKD repeat protein